MGSQVDINTCMMHVHMLKKEWVDLNRHTVPQSHPCFHVTMQRGRPVKESQVDMYTCTDACAHLNQGVGPQAG